MNFQTKEGYRLNVAMIIFNEDKKVLFCRRKNTENWQVPQGGVDQGEKIESAMLRELEEEVGLLEREISIIAESHDLIYYDIPKNIRSKVLGGKYKGQAQKYFLLKLTSGVINLNKEKNPEFDDYKWVPFWFPLRRVVDFKKEAYRKALIEFKDKMN